MTTQASRKNLSFYAQTSEGRRDYWRKMAAPRHRVATLVGLIAADRPASLVDMGCGDGSLLDEIAQAIPGAKLAGVDLSPEQIEDNRRRRPDVRWYTDDLDREFTLDEIYDAVVATEVIEHLDRPEDFLRSCARVGKRLYLSTQSGSVRETERRVGHRRHYQANEMRDLLEATGWTAERVWNTGFPFHDLSKWYANRDPDRSMQQFGERPYGLRENAICWVLRGAFKLNSQRAGAQLFAVARSHSR